MALNYLNYGLQNPLYMQKNSNMDWINQQPIQQATTPKSSGGGIGSILSGGLAGASLGPIGALAGAGIGAAGAGISAYSENKKYEEEKAEEQRRYEEQKAEEKKRYKQGVGRNAVSLLNDNFVKALARSRGGF